MFCRHCGNIVKNNSNPCNKCGCDVLLGETFCQNCGIKVNSKSGACPNCKNDLKYLKVAYTHKGEKIDVDQEDWLANIQAFLFPLTHGLIFYTIWRKDSPVKAKAVLNYMIYGMISYTILFMAYFLMIVILSTSS